MIIFRYLTKEVFAALFGVTFILLLVFLSNLLLRYLSYAASGKIASSVLLQLIGIEIPYLLALLLPLGLYLGILLTYGRLYVDNELRVIHASGLSVGHLLKITALMAMVIMVLVSFLVLWVNPKIAAKKEQIVASSTNIFNTIMPGRFQSSSDGARVIYVEKIARNRKSADNIFIAEQSNKNPEAASSDWTVLSAEHGYQMKEPTTQARFVLAADGYRYEGVPGQNNFKIIQFEKYAVRALTAVPPTHNVDNEAIPTMDLIHQYTDTEKAAELQWRVSLPLSVLLLALLAVPLSQVRPRHGRYSMLFPAILIYVVYVNLLFVGRNLLELQKVSTLIGLWWVHGLLLLGLFIILRFQASRQAL